MANYWQRRFQAVEAMNNKTAKETVRAVTPAFDEAQAQIEKELNAWYARFAKNNEISLADAKKLLNTRELKEFRWDVEEYIKWGRQNALDQAWMKQLENASSRYHINRLEALKVRTQNAAERAFGNELDQLDQMAARIYVDDYYHTAYEIQKGLGIGWDVGQIDQNKLDKIVSKPWTTDKMTFSDRIWKSKTQLVDSLHKELTQMCILGRAPDEAIDNIAKRMNVSKGQAGRLIMTEAAYFGSTAQKDCFNDLDVEKFEVVATLDNRTSDTCRDMDGKVFDMKDFEAGVTAPPFHVWCRSCTAPWFPDNDDGTRIARGADGKTYQVPAGMKYQDWKDCFVDKVKDPADWLKATTAKDIKRVRDSKTFEELKTYMEDTYSITLEDDVTKLDFESVRESLDGVEFIMKEFPKAKDVFTGVGIDKSGMMSAGFGGWINFNPKYFSTRKAVLDAHRASTFHPKGNNAFSSGSHEAGHLLELKLIKLKGGGGVAWQNCTHAKEIVSQACKAVKKTPEGKGKLIPELKSEISGYARTDASECLAEAVSDYSLNKENSAPLSRAIWKILKEELG